MAGAIQGFFGAGGLRLPAGSTVRAAACAQRLPSGLIQPRLGGQPLPNEVRSQMESHFATDFSSVRVHVGPEAGSIGAKAFTLGSNLYFAPGQYDTASRSGLALLGHELAHVVQQRQGRVRNPFGSGIAVVRDPRLEAEADRLGQIAAGGRSAGGAQAKPAPARAARSVAARQRTAGFASSSYPIQMAEEPKGRRKVVVSAPGTTLPTKGKKRQIIKSKSSAAVEAIELNHVVDMSAAGTVSAGESIGTFGCGPCVGVIAISARGVTCLHISCSLYLSQTILTAAISRERIANLIPQGAHIVQYCSKMPNPTTAKIVAALRYAHPHAIAHSTDGIYYKGGAIRTTSWSQTLVSDHHISNQLAEIA